METGNFRGFEVALQDAGIALITFNRPGQGGACYAWWVGAETGYLRRQAMVATGHFMLTTYFDQNQPVAIQLPEEAASTGG